MLPVGLLPTLGLVLIRTSAFVLASPMFGDGSGFGGYKIGLIGVLSLITMSTLDLPLDTEIGPLVFGAMASREALIGAALGFVLQLVMVAVRVGGELIGAEMAFNMSAVADPATGVNTPLITRIYEGLFLLGLLAVDGHHILMRALFESFGRAPVGRIQLELGLVHAIRTLFSEMFTSGLTFAAPVMMLLVMVSMLIGLLARAVPQLNVLEIGFTLRIAVALVAMTVFAPLFGPVMTSLYEALDAGLDAVLDGLEA